MNFGRKNIQHSTKYRARNRTYKTSNIVACIDLGIAPGIMLEILKGTMIGLALGLELVIVLRKRPT